MLFSFLALTWGQPGHCPTGHLPASGTMGQGRAGSSSVQWLGALILLWPPLSHWVTLGQELGHSGPSGPQLHKGKDNTNICSWDGPENAITKPSGLGLARGAEEIVG